MCDACPAKGEISRLIHVYNVYLWVPPSGETASRHMRLILLILFSPLLLLVALLGLRRRDIVNLPADHPEMAKAITDAHASLPEFRRLLESPEPDMDNFAIKAGFTAG